MERYWSTKYVYACKMTSTLSVTVKAPCGREGLDIPVCGWEDRFRFVVDEPVRCVAYNLPSHVNCIISSVLVFHLFYRWGGGGGGHADTTPKLCVEVRDRVN